MFSGLAPVEWNVESSVLRPLSHFFRRAFERRVLSAGAFAFAYLGIVVKLILARKPWKLRSRFRCCKLVFFLFALPLSANSILLHFGIYWSGELCSAVLLKSVVAKESENKLLTFRYAILRLNERGCKCRLYIFTQFKNLHVSWVKPCLFFFSKQKYMYQSIFFLGFDRNLLKLALSLIEKYLLLQNSHHLFSEIFIKNCYIFKLFNIFLWNSLLLTVDVITTLPNAERCFYKNSC